MCCAFPSLDPLDVKDSVSCSCFELFVSRPSVDVRIYLHTPCIISYRNNVTNPHSRKWVYWRPPTALNFAKNIFHRKPPIVDIITYSASEGKCQPYPMMVSAHNGHNAFSGSVRSSVSWDRLMEVRLSPCIVCIFFEVVVV